MIARLSSLLSTLLVIAGAIGSPAFAKTVTIGFDLPLSGEFQSVGNNAKNVGELILAKMNQGDGFRIAGERYDLAFIYSDNNSLAVDASNVAVELISKQNVHAIVGPLSSRQAVPAGGIANAFSTPMIAPWSTSPATTKDRPFVFRSGYLLEVQAPVLTTFIANEFKAKKAAVLYDIVSTYPRTMAKSFHEVFEKANGAGSIAAFEEFRTGDTDFSAQLSRIVSSDAEVLFTPQHYNEVPEIVKQARKMGWNKPIIGSNSWAGGNLSQECGTACNGLFFVGNYAAGNATGLSKEFVTLYQSAYQELPDEVAALTWDAVQVILAALQKTGGSTGNLMKDRKLLRDQIAGLKDFEGVTGKMSFNESGDPEKCAVMIKIDDQGINSNHSEICP